MWGFYFLFRRIIILPLNRKVQFCILDKSNLHGLHNKRKKPD